MPGASSLGSRLLQFMSRQSELNLATYAQGRVETCKTGMRKCAKDKYLSQPLSESWRSAELSYLQSRRGCINKINVGSEDLQKDKTELLYVQHDAGALEAPYQNRCFTSPAMPLRWLWGGARLLFALFGDEVGSTSHHRDSRQPHEIKRLRTRPRRPWLAWGTGTS